MQQITIKELQRNFENQYVALVGRRHFEAAAKTLLDEKILNILTKVENEIPWYKVQVERENLTHGLWTNKSDGRYTRGDSSGRLRNATCYRLENTLIAVVFYYVDHYAATANLIFFAKEEDLSHVENT